MTCRHHEPDETCADCKPERPVADEVALEHIRRLRELTRKDKP